MATISGFTLIEFSIVLVIIGLIIGYDIGSSLNEVMCRMEEAARIFGSAARFCCFRHAAKFSDAKLEDELTEFIHTNGDYLFMAFAFLCLLYRLAPFTLAEIATSRTFFGSNASNYRNHAGVSRYVVRR